MWRMNTSMQERIDIFDWFAAYLNLTTWRQRLKLKTKERENVKRRLANSKKNQIKAKNHIKSNQSTQIQFKFISASNCSRVSIYIFRYDSCSDFGYGIGINTICEAANEFNSIELRSIQLNWNAYSNLYTHTQRHTQRETHTDTATCTATLRQVRKHTQGNSQGYRVRRGARRCWRRRHCRQLCREIGFIYPVNGESIGMCNAG